jgi:hypothetical protein
MIKEYVTKKDIVIPAGIVFKKIEGENHEWQNNEYEATINKGNRELQFMVISEDYMDDNKDEFEERLCDNSDVGLELHFNHDEDFHRIVKSTNHILLHGR